MNALWHQLTSNRPGDLVVHSTTSQKPPHCSQQHRNQRRIYSASSIPQVSSSSWHPVFAHRDAPATASHLPAPVLARDVMGPHPSHPHISSLCLHMSSINKIINTEVTFWSFAKPVSCVKASRYDVSSYINLGTKLESYTSQSQATQCSHGNSVPAAPSAEPLCYTSCYKAGSWLWTPRPDRHC